MLLLPSSALLGGLCFLVACISGSQGREQPIWRDSWMQPLLLAGLLMLVGCCFAHSGALAWAGLANWLPFFWAFWACRPHLETVNQRRQAAWMLVAGTVPVLVTGFGQMLLGWSGPWQLGGGAIVWFVAPGGQPSGRLSGLFDYANIAGAWLGVVWPLMLACVLRPDAWWRRSGAFALALSTAVAVVFTQSRNAMGALALALPLVIGPLQWSWLLPLLALLTVPLALAVLPGIPIGLKSWSAALLPDRIAERLLDQDTPTAWKHTRLGQWGYGIELVAARPWFGWGAAAFSVLYPIYAVKRWHGHSHNLPLELAISHGLPVTVLIVGTVFVLLVVALKRGMLRRDPLERAWWAAALVMVVMHATDLPLFDSRMNILGWVLLAGLANVSQPSKLVRDALAVSGEPADL
jgi:O-antigen ligase